VFTSYRHWSLSWASWIQSHFHIPFLTCPVTHLVLKFIALYMIRHINILGIWINS
jgi:hypothetical protein